MDLAEDEGEDVAQVFGVMAAGTGDAKERDLLGGEKLVDKGVSPEVAGIPAGAVVEQDAAEDAVGFVPGQKEVDVLVRDLVEG